MSTQLSQLLFHSLLIVIFVAIASASARSAHFGDTNQMNQDQDNANNLLDSGLTPQQIEELVRLSEYNNQIAPLSAAWYRLVRNPEVKRQSRYRQCYFNPVSCFRK